MDKELSSPSYATRISIDCLPDELITMILRHVSPKDITNFATTCRKYNELINTNNYLWKEKTAEMVPKEIYKIIEKHNEGDWLFEIRQYYFLKQKIFAQLMTMSPRFYSRINGISILDAIDLFSLATANNMSYYYTIHILQDIIKKGNKIIEQNNSWKPYTLTELHYAKMILRHLIHAFLSLKWVTLTEKRELTPDKVIHFFLQWIDPANTHLEEDFEDKIKQITKNVQDLVLKHKQKMTDFEKQDQFHNEWTILTAISEVIYKDMHMAVSAAADLDSLNMTKVIDSKCGNVIVVAALYQVVAKQCGVKCDLIAFPNHLFLEWKFTRKPRTEIFTIDLGTGNLEPKRRCPFATDENEYVYRYDPDAMLHYTYSAYLITMGAIRNRNTQNALLLLDFLGRNNTDIRYKTYIYKDFLPYLLQRTHILLSAPLNLKYLHDRHLQIIMQLANLNRASESVNHNIIPKKRDHTVLYAVGMICYHKNYHYVCIIRGWDTRSSPNTYQQLDGRSQPFYNTIASDQSERYVPQEHLVVFSHPTRLYHLEDHIAREFTHFDGFAYVLNDQKKVEYPDEDVIVETYRNQFRRLT